MTILALSTAALVTAFILDLLFGDPHNFPHIIRWIGYLISALDKRLPHNVRGGLVLALIVLSCCIAVPLILLICCYRINPLLGYAIESFLCYQLLAVKSLKTESMKVYNSLQNGDVEGARKSLSMIVGRDTDFLDRNGIIRAVVETIAENTSDGVVAPIMFIMLGGAVGGCLYKGVNTMDSMVGYKNEKYINFGRFAAKTDDIFNYIPSRLCALLMIAAAFLLRLDSKNAFRVWRRDRRNHASPNSAQTESVCAGALRIQLAGPASYHGKILNKPYIGDDIRPIEDKDIIYANKLMIATSAIMLIISVLFRVLLLGVIYFAKV